MSNPHKPDRPLRGADRKSLFLPYLLCLLIAVLEIIVLIILGCKVVNMTSTVFLLEGLSAFFLAYFCFLAPDKLPKYYDENPISRFSDGPVHMNLPGVTFHNRNWPHMLRGIRRGLMIAMVAYPPAYLIVEKLLPAHTAIKVNLILLFIFIFGCLIVPIYHQHHKHP